MNASLLSPEYDARQAVLDGIKARYEARGFCTPKLKKAGLPLKVCDPHRVAFLRFSDVLARTSQPQSQPPSPEAATRILRQSAHVLGWRFLLYGHDPMPGSPPIAAAHAVIDPRTGEYRLAELNEGAYVRGMPKAAQAAVKVLGEDLPYDFLLLVVPSLFTAALWLRNRNIPDISKREDTDSSTCDLLVPILPVGDDFHKFNVRKPNEFFDDLLKVKPADHDTD